MPIALIWRPGRLKELTGAPVYAHEWEADIISGDRKRSLFHTPLSPLSYLSPADGLNLNLAKHTPVNVDHFIHEGDRIGPIQVLFAPGHSPATWLLLARTPCPRRRRCDLHLADLYARLERLLAEPEATPDIAPPPGGIGC